MMPTDTPAVDRGRTAPRWSGQRHAAGAARRRGPPSRAPPWPSGGPCHGARAPATARRAGPVAGGRARAGGGRRSTSAQPSTYSGSTAGSTIGHALAPALGVAGDDAHEQDVALGLGAERGAERRHQRHADPPQLDAGQLQRVLPFGVTTYHPARSKPTTVRRRRAGRRDRVHGERHRAARPPGPRAQRRSMSAGTATRSSLRVAAARRPGPPARRSRATTARRACTAVRPGLP